MMIELFRHNETAYLSAAAMMEEAGRAAVVHPTGTGKSFIGFKLCLDHEDKRICWLSPSEYIWQTQLENLKKAADYTPRNVTFYTYSKLILMEDEELSAIAPDYIVLDEFHRCGARIWQKAIARLMAMFPNARVLGLSATAIRYLDNRRNMAQELFGGHIASYMSLGEAIVRGILRQPVYVLSFYEYEDLMQSRREEITRCRSRAAKDAAQQYYDALRRALEKADRLDVIFARHMKEKDGKYIVFCSSRQHMEQMIGKVSEWFAGVDQEPHIYKASYSNPLSEKEFRSFREDESGHLKLLFCIDMLNEGIHVEDVSGVILLRPTVSPIIYRQQIGRALSSGSDRTPVIFDVVMNIDNLSSIDALEEEMAQSAAYFRTEEQEGEIAGDRFRLMDELGDCRKLFRKLDEVLAASWDQMYEEARRYYEANGHLDVPKRYVTEEGYTLGSWVSVQRRIYGGKVAGVLDDVRIEKLERIGMVWDNQWEVSWDRHFSAAEEYYETFGDLLVPAEYETPEGLFLGRWIGRLRARKRAGSFPAYLKEEKIAALDRIGMVWDVPEEAWMRNYRAALQYFHDNGHLDVPSSYVSENGVALGQWISSMRTARRTMGKEGGTRRIDERQIGMLDEIGMIWEKKADLKWEAAYEHAVRYRKEYGDLKVPATYRTEDGFHLGKWIYRQRTAGKSKPDDGKPRGKTLTEEKIRRLDEIGMVWG